MFGVDRIRTIRQEPGDLGVFNGGSQIQGFRIASFLVVPRFVSEDGPILFLGRVRARVFRKTVSKRLPRRLFRSDGSTFQSFEKEYDL